MEVLFEGEIIIKSFPSIVPILDFPIYKTVFIPSLYYLQWRKIIFLQVKPRSWHFYLTSVRNEENYYNLNHAALDLCKCINSC